MELCTARAVSNLPRFSSHSSRHTRFQQLRSNLSVSEAFGLNFKSSGLRDYTKLSLKVLSSDESSSSPYTKEGSDSVVTTLEETRPVEKEEYVDTVSNAAPEEDSPEENISQVFESVLGKLDIEKLDSDDKYSLVFLGVGSLTALYLVTAIVGAIDSIPLVPKLMQVVGLGYTAWFTARYLVLKESREELVAKIEDIKDQILGTNDD